MGLLTDEGPKSNHPPPSSPLHPFPKFCGTYPTMMELGSVIPYLTKIQKYINDLTHPLSSADIIIFSREIREFCYNKKKQAQIAFWYIISKFLNFLKRFCNKLCYNFDDVIKNGYPQAFLKNGGLQ